MSRFFQDSDNLGDLRGKAVRSGLAVMIANALRTLVQFGSTLVLARLLAPEDFGLMAIVFALTGFAPMLIDLGLGDAAVQRPKITAAQVSSLFWISVGLSCFVALVLALAGRSIGSVYHQAGLGEVLAVFSLTFVFNSLSIQHRALLMRTMRFTDVTAIELIACIGGAGVAIAAAALGSGYWALVVRPVVTAAIRTVGSWIRCDWRPGRPRYDVEVKSMMKFGLNVSGGAVSVLMANAVDRAVMGLIYLPGVVGLYQNAMLIYDNAVSAITSALQTVGVSALSRVQHDPASLKRHYTSALSMTSFFSMPAFALLAVIAPDLVPLLLGAKWAASGAILSIFAIRGIVHVVEASQGWLHLPLGRPDRGVRWAILTGLVQAGAVFTGLPYGVKGVAAAIVVARSALAFPSVIYAGYPVALRWGEVMRGVGKPLIGSAFVLVVGKASSYLLAEQFGPVFRVVAVSGICIASYLVLVVGFFRLRQPLRLARSAIGKFVPERFRPRLPAAAAPSDASTT